jgi:hypothetical protein
MATGGIFQLITNDGRQDRMLMATSLLKKRLQIIESARAADPLISDSTPTLVDIEKTHILFTNAHFKPFAAIGYEYNKVRASSGSTTLGSTVQFSIPQFGDFFHDMVLHVKLKQPILTTTATEDADKPGMRWCDFPGERLMKKVQFEVNGNPLDEYSSSVYNFYREYCVPPHKKTGWFRCMGQQLPHHGYLNQADWVRSNSAPAAGDHRFLVEVTDGMQTPSGQKDQTDAGALELFVPLLFWYNKDPRLSVPSVAIPYGQRFINIELASQEELVGVWPRGSSTWANPGGSLDRSTNLISTVELYINNIFVNPEIHDIFIKRIGFTLIRVHRQQNHNASKASDEVLLQQLKWPIETLFVGMKIRDYNLTTTDVQAEHLDKWHKFSEVTKTAFTTSGVKSARQLALTVTDLSITTAGVVTGVGTDLDGSVLGAVVTPPSTVAAVLPQLQAGDVLVNTSTGSTYNVETDPTSATDVQVSAIAVALVNDVGPWSVCRSIEVAATADVHARTIDSLTIKAHGIPIYNEFPAGFYNAYVPFHYGGPNIQTPEDVGALMVTFGLYPGTYQPSGHINVSRAREFYLEYTSSVISSSKEGTLVVVASAINFLLISDGSAVLRYST